MTPLDWLVVAFAVVAGTLGAMRGFLVSALTLAGLAAGAFLGARFAPRLLEEGSSSPYAPAVALIAALALGAILALVFEALGARVRRGVRAWPVVAVDALLGATLGAAIALLLAWLAGAVALQTPGARALRTEVQRSAVLQALNDLLPPSGPILRALARFDPLPEIDGPSPDAIPAPRRGIAADPDVRAARNGTVRVLGLACGLGVSGSGWIAAPGLVVTNAHVVAGTAGEVLVERRGLAPRLDARAVAFDPRNDLAVLAVPEAGGPVLPLAGDPAAGTAGAILGYPGNGPFDVRAARLGETRVVVSQDAYGRGPVRRSVVSLRGRLRPGNSGGPVVDADGRVLATVFASSRSGSSPGGYGVPNRAVRALLGRVGAASPEVSTGPCAA